jgi:hypothetical protein
VLPHSQGLSALTLQVPFSRHFPIFAGALALTMAASWLNNRNFSPVESMSADFKAAEAKGIIVSPFWCWLVGQEQQLLCADDPA